MDEASEAEAPLKTLTRDDLKSAEIKEELREYCRMDNARHLKERLGSFFDGVWQATTQLQDYVLPNEGFFSSFSSSLLGDLLCEAVEAEAQESLRVLLACCSSSDVNSTWSAKDIWGETPLTAAVKTGNIEMCEFLLEKEANVNLVCCGETPLTVALKIGNIEMCEFLLEKEANVNLVDYGETPLTAAVKTGNIEMCEFLLEKEADVHLAYYDETPLTAAVKTGNIEMCEFLLEKEANVNLVYCGETPLTAAVKTANIDMCKFLIQKEADVNLADGGETPLTAAVKIENIEMCKFLLEKEADVILADGDETPLTAAVKTGNIEMCKFLLDKEANVNLVYCGETPLTAAVKTGNIEMCEFLLYKEADVNGGGIGETPLTAAVKIGNIEMCKFLLEKETDVNGGGIGETPLTAAVKTGNIEMCEFLLEKEADVNGGGIWDETPLTAAVKTGNIEMCKFLLDKEANVNLADGWGETPLTAAVKAGNIEMIKFLLEKEANVSLVYGWDETPLTAAVKTGNVEMCELLLDREADVNCRGIWDETPLTAAVKTGNVEMCELLLDREADVNCRGIGETPLTAAVKTGNIEMCEFLLEKEADVNGGGIGETPLTAAVKTGNIEMCEFLLGKEADVNGGGIGGRTPLHEAAVSSNKEVCEFLLQHGADVESRDEGGRTPLHEAAVSSNKEVCEFLLQHGADVKSRDEYGLSAVDIAMTHGSSSCLSVLLEYLVRRVNVKEAGQFLKASLENARKDPNRYYQLHLVEVFVSLLELRSLDHVKASHILAIILGLKGTGKTTFVHSLKTTDQMRPLFRRDRQKELDDTTPTEGMEVSVFVDKFSHTVHFVDYAGQAVFAVAHDLLSTRLVTPMVAFVAVNATESKEEVAWRLREAAATLIGRKVPSGKLQKVFIVATHGDEVDKTTEKAVLGVIKKVKDEFKDVLDFHSAFVLDARSSSSAEMNVLRNRFAEVGKKLLEESDPQPVLLSEVHELLPKLQKVLKTPVTTRKEFTDALLSELKANVADEESAAKFWPRIVEQYVTVLTAFGLVWSFPMDSSLADYIINDPAWLFQYIVGMAFTPWNTGREHIPFTNGRASVDEVLRVLDKDVGKPGNARLILDMLLHLGLFIRHNEEEILAPSLADYPESLLGLWTTDSRFSVYAGIMFSCDRHIKFTEGLITSLLADLFDYFNEKHGIPSKVWRGTINIRLAQSQVEGCVFFSPTRTEASILVRAPNELKADAHYFLRLLRSRFFTVINKYSPGTEPHLTEAVASSSSIQEQLASQRKLSVLKSHQLASVESALMEGPDTPLMVDMEHRIDKAGDLLHYHENHIGVMTREGREELEFAFNTVQDIPRLAACLVPRCATTSLKTPCAVLEKWESAGYAQTTEALLHIAQSQEQLPGAAIISKVLEREKTRRERAVPDIFVARMDSSWNLPPLVMDEAVTETMEESLRSVEFSECRDVFGLGQKMKIFLDNDEKHALAHAFAESRDTEAADSFESIIKNYMAERNCRQVSLSNVPGLLLYFQASNRVTTFGELFDIVIPQCKRRAKKVAILIRDAAEVVKRQSRI